jgi:hypothetical protein
LVYHSYDAHLYNCSSNALERNTTLMNLNARLTDIDTVCWHSFVC